MQCVIDACERENLANNKFAMLMHLLTQSDLQACELCVALTYFSSRMVING